MKSLPTTILWFTTFTALIGFLWILIQGFNNQLMIYKDKHDLLRLVLTIVSGLILIGLLNRAPSEDLHLNFFLSWIASPVISIVTFILVMNNFIQCIEQNNQRLVMGCLIAFYRYFYILVVVLLMIWIIDGNRNKRRSTGIVVLEIMGIATVGYGMFRLINGDRVEMLRNNVINNK